MRNQSVFYKEDYMEISSPALEEEKGVSNTQHRENNADTLKRLIKNCNHAEVIVSSLQSPLIILDKRFYVRFVNKAFCKKFRLAKEETEEKLLFKVDNGQWNVSGFREVLKKVVVENIRVENFEMIYNASPERKTLNISIKQVVQHKKILILIAITDITEIKNRYTKEIKQLNKKILTYEINKVELELAVQRRTKQLEKKNLELESANKDLESFNYVSSHDLQEPLRKIQNFSLLLLKGEGKRLSIKGKGYFQSMVETAQRMQMLIEDLLAYSRAKNAERKFEKTDLNEILEEVKKEYTEILKEKQGVIVVKKLCQVNVIRFQIIQLFHNLFSNAFKFSSPDRPICITIKSTIAKGNKLKHDKLLANTEYCHITFSDNGIGFDPKYKERIFEVFQRLHTVSEYNGTGIGLSICKRIVANHQGFISATGRVNKGARFDIYFPTKKIS